MPVTAEVLQASRAQLGEGALWDAQRQRLYWIDIMAAKVFIYDPAADQTQTFDTSVAVGTVVPRASGGLMLALANGFAFLDTRTGRIEPWANPERNLPKNRFNDGKCDPAGRFWAGSMAPRENPGQANLWCLEKDHTVTKKIEGASISNGIVWSADAKTMFYIDTPTRRIDRFDYDAATGSIANRRTLVEVPHGFGSLDGMAIDADDHLWVAVWGGGRVIRVNPGTGELEDAIAVPGAQQVTSITLGGPRLDTAYITTAAVGVKDFSAQPNAGALFVAQLKDTRGVPAVPYGG